MTRYINLRRKEANPMTDPNSAATGAGEIDNALVLRGMARDGDGYFSQHDIKRLHRAADALAASRQREEALRKALEDLIAECDDARHIERGAGGMTIDAQINRTVINGVRARKVEDARAALAQEDGR